MLTEEDIKRELGDDTDGLKTYEFIANNIDDIDGEDALLLADNIKRVDLNGQFCASAARFFHAVSPEKYAAAVTSLIEALIEKDRERRYMTDLLPSIYGEDYADHIEELSADSNFRRIYKRLFPSVQSL